ncbi:MAG TPA: hypothetical protein VFS80_07535 [Burkholderiales bacterium]|nr:hypothetical protein [Burkholderiales bacterium]
MKTSLISLPKIYADWSAVGWAMVLGYAPGSSDLRPNGKPALHEAVKEWESEGGTLKETPQITAARKSARKAAKRKPAPMKAPGKKRAPMKKKRTKR